MRTQEHRILFWKILWGRGSSRRSREKEQYEEVPSATLSLVWVTVMGRGSGHKSHCSCSSSGLWAAFAACCKGLTSGERTPHHLRTILQKRGCWGPLPAYFIAAGVQKGALVEHQSIPEISANSKWASFKMKRFHEVACIVFWNTQLYHDSEFFLAMFPIVYKAHTPKLVAHYGNCLVLKIILSPLFSAPEFSMFTCMYVGGIFATNIVLAF